MGRREIKGLKARVGREHCLSRGEVEIYRPEESEGEVSVTMRCNSGSHSVTSREVAEGQLQE